MLSRPEKDKLFKLTSPWTQRQLIGERAYLVGENLILVSPTCVSPVVLLFGSSVCHNKE